MGIRLRLRLISRDYRVSMSSTFEREKRICFRKLEAGETTSHLLIILMVLLWHFRSLAMLEVGFSLITSRGTAVWCSCLVGAGMICRRRIPRMDNGWRLTQTGLEMLFPRLC